MKKLSSVAVSLLLLAFLSTTVSAQSNPLVNQAKTLKAMGQGHGLNWIDADGDGICDNFGTVKQGSGNRGGNGTGVCDGTGRGLGDGSGVRPQDGTGFGKRKGGGNGACTGVCNGTGSKGSARKGAK